jgi:hypothetical protein
MTLGDLVLGIIMIAILIEAFINIKKLGFEKYSIGRSFSYWMIFCGKLVFLIIALVYFLDKINWNYKIF